MTYALLGALILACQGCAARWTDGSEDALAIPAAVDLGFIPPEGGSATVTLRNLGSRPVRLERVSSSCGCTAAEWPRQIDGRSTATIKLRVKGLQELTTKGVELIIKPASLKPRHVALAFTTGALPQLDRSEFQQRERADVNTAECHSCKLWINTLHSNERVTCEVLNNSPVSLTLHFDSEQPTGVLATADARTAIIARPGLYALPVRLTVNVPAGQQRTHFTRAIISMGDRQRIQPLQFVFVRPIHPTIQPERALMFYNQPDELLGKTRQFVIRCESGVACKLTTIPDDLEVKVAPLNEQTWLLTANVRKGVSIADGKREIVVECGELRLTTVLEIKSAEPLRQSPGIAL